MYPILDQLRDPNQIREMTSSQREQLAEELRCRIAEVVSENGGHLGPNLGAVEIIIACHLVFDLKQDRLVFDVGHQSYPHKLLTHRHEQFNTLRQKDGISGYPHQKESSYDVFRSGHASTAISTALGIQAAFSTDQATLNRRAIALVGDGSMTGGMAFEGLNHAGHMKKNLIVILNDNSMSISPTVGGLANAFHDFRYKKIYNQFRAGLIKNIKKIPKLGATLENIVNFCLEEAKKLVNPSQIFTVLGFEYYGPLNGNNIDEVANALKFAQEYTDRPVLIHALTQKGKDYMPKGRQGEKTIGPHALSPEKKSKGTQKEEASVLKSEISYSKTFTRIIKNMAEEDSRVIAITAAMSEGTGLIDYSKSYPDQFFDVGICEAHAVGFSAGLNSGGKKPVFAVYSTFLQRAFDQLFHDVVLQGNITLLLCIDRAGLVGDDGPSHHGVYDIAYLRLFPHFILMAPKDGLELESMMRLGIEARRPVAIRYPRGSVPPKDFFTVFDQDQTIQIGVSEVLRWRKDLALFAYGEMNVIAARVWTVLAQEGIEVTLINARFAQPLDQEILQRLHRNHHTIVTLEDGVIKGGLGSAVLEICNDLALHFKAIIRCGVPDRLVEHASREEQLKECGLDVQSMVRLVKDHLSN